MPVPEFVVRLRERVGQEELWLPAVTAVVVRGEGDAREVLLVQRADNGRWTPVTGILDPGEEPAVGARREVLEETGVEVSVDRLVATSAGAPQTHVNGDRAVYLDLTFACTWLAGEAHVADDESAAVRWCPVSDVDVALDVAAHRERVAAALSGEQRARFRA
ncbi:NUDIX domain-containing protein [Nocardioides sp. CFH 31398]|uniref:NUDIX hydrolase n=1 Tax=Nocardioides sp. CFH 31398 TaxID=2919579 RepID=UPI001F05B388|nr:NUDIX domain-containing protein [Nocardioides sp. CFH 31398]MCH1867154.1 NUDIX domain-containing protein [Nocardioides sp. CFH 31398]